MTRLPQHTNGTGLAAYDPFATPEAAPAHHDGSPTQVLQKIHRLLRGRYILAFVLAAIGAAAGAVGGFMATKPKWQSLGAIQVEPMLPVMVRRIDETEQPFFDSYVQEQVGSLMDQQTLDHAMMSTAWLKFGRGLDFKAKRDFHDSLDVAVEHNNRKRIRIRFVDVDKDATKVAVQQIVDAYREIFGPRLLLTTNATIQTLKREKEKFDADLKALNTRIVELSRPYGATDLTTVHQAAIDAHRIAKQDKDELELAVGQARIAAKARPAPAPDSPDKPAQPLDWEEASFEIAKVDQTMSDLIRQRQDARTDLQRIKIKYSPTSQKYLDAVDRVASLEASVKERCEGWMAAHNNTLPVPTGTARSLVTKSLETLEAEYELAQRTESRKLDEAVKINETQLEIKSTQQAIAEKNKDLTTLEGRLNDLTLGSKGSANSNAIGRIEITNEGTDPTFYSDNRKKLAAMGFLLGGSFPVFIVMLLGALDRRFRYSEDAQAGADRVPLLGILPYLPESMSDPEQAGIAAHCVHQIRTMLQISAVEHDRKVFAVTSATSGDGKTSLCLSLGLSFAASGSNTCLIDFDMIGGGLTANMGARTDVGLLAAIDDGQLDGHVRPTAFPRLSLIPVGRDDAQEISRLSPKLVRRLIEQARKEFDVVVIDTGPILGSIEATLVCGIADGVVLALGRGQQKAMANRAIEMLRSVGAKIMGVVFNRAQANDFKRTVSQSVRSIPAHDSGNNTALKALPAMGPMARTVVSHTRSDA